jgi:hypothetical protein
MDPHTGRIAQTISLTLPTPVAPGDRRFLPSSMSAGRGVVWVGTARGWLAQIDARSGRVLSMVRAPFDATGRIVVGPHGLWVAESVLGVGFVPRSSARLTVRVVPSGRRRRVAVDELAVGDGRVWIYGVIAEPAGSAPGGFVLTNSAELATLDESSGRITHRMRFRTGPYQIVYGNGALFAADFRSGQLYRIDPSYGVQSLRPVRGPGTLVAVTPGAIWATTASGTLRRLSVPGA